MRQIRLSGIALLAGTMVVTTFSSRNVTAEAVFPRAAWQPRSPRELRLDRAAVEAVATALGGRGCIIKDGYLVKAWGSQSLKGDWFSSAKPVLSTLLFFAIEEGRVGNVDTRIADFGWKLKPQDRSMTFRHLGSMTSGYARPEPPGMAWAYNDFAIQLYQKTLFDRLFDGKPEDVANASQRFGCLGLEDGLSFQETNRRMSASVRDFARICWFWLNRGRWHDKQLLPCRFFDQYMKPQTSKDLPQTRSAKTDDYLGIGSYGGGSDHFTQYGAGIYGFNWWFNDTGRLHTKLRTWPDAPPDTVMTIGVGGNSAAMMPSLNLVVVAAGANWGPLRGGDANAVMNGRLRLIAAAGSQKPASRASASADALPNRPAAKGQSSATTSGQLKKWYPVTLTFRGPQSKETADPNPFLDYRLDVTFVHAERRVVVPGYFAADGAAADSGATAGSCWRVHFVPNRAGTWKWTASFRGGKEVAISADPEVGEPASLDGTEGEFEIAPPGTQVTDPRGRGMLHYVGKRYLRFAETDAYFLKGGTDSPENFLAYYEFDGTRPTHHYAPHARDFRPGDPTWAGSKGRNIVGALNYLAEKRVNSLYFLTMNVEGDGRDVWPWIGARRRYRYDCSKLDQWEIVFSHMDQLGIMLHVVTQEQENDQLLDKGELGPQRRLYYRELVARFAHHLAITWNLGEENTNTDAQRKAFARAIHALDPYDHPVVVHTFPGQYDKIYAPLLADPSIEGASLQTNETHQQTIRWIDRSQALGRPWVVCLDEIGPADTGVKPDEDDYHHDAVRKRHLWGHFMAGGAGVEWLFGYKYAHNDINLEDFRSRDHMWELTRIARQFFLEYLPFEKMGHADPLVKEGTAYCFAKAGEIYALYLPEGGTARLDLGHAEATYDVDWYNPRTGGPLQKGTLATIHGPGPQTTGQPPCDRGKDWAVVIRRRGGM